MVNALEHAPTRLICKYKDCYKFGQEVSYTDGGHVLAQPRAHRVIGVGIGIAMGASENFTLRPVHAHINLLGWATMALAGLTYAVFLQAARSVLALVISEALAALGIVVFAVNLFWNVRVRSGKQTSKGQVYDSLALTMAALTYEIMKSQFVL